MKVKRKRVACLAMFLAFLTVLMTIWSSLLSIPAMAAETEKPYYTITVSSTDHGDIEVDQNAVLQAGNQILLTVKADDGYKLSSLAVTGENEKTISVTDCDGNEVTGDYPDALQLCMPESNVTIEAQFVSENVSGETITESDTANEEKATPSDSNQDMVDSVIGNTLDAIGTNVPFAVTMNNAERSMARAASPLTLTKYEKQFACYHGNGDWDCTESYLKIGDTVAWCIEPAIDIGSSGGSYSLNSDAMTWLKNRYGWSYAKIMNLSKAVYLAKDYYGSDWLCNYVLVQNLIWKEVDANGRYVLTNGAHKTSHVCGHLDTKAKVDEAVQNVWSRFYSYNTLPSFDKKTVYGTAGQSIWVQDDNVVVGQTSFICPSNVWISKGQNNNGIWINSNSSMAGKTDVIRFYKNAIPNSSEAFLVYTRTGYQSVTTWSGTMNPTYGGLRVVFNRSSYIQAHYKAREKVSPSMDLYISKKDCDTDESLAGAKFEIYMDDQKMATVTSDQDGKAVYHWRGAEVWTDYVEATEPVASYSGWNSAYQKAKKSVQDSLATKVEELKTQTTHTWKVVEIEAPYSYKINPQEFEQTYDLTTHAIEVTITDEKDAGYIQLKKESSNPDLTENNSCYSLAGAEYGVYDSREDALNDTNRLTTLVTDASGNTNKVWVKRGRKYVKELKASQGYLICDGSVDDSDNGIHGITLTDENTIDNPGIVHCVEPVGTDPFDLALNKMDVNTGGAAQGIASLAGGIFEVTYYTNINAKTDGTPARTWYFKTNEDGKLSCQNENSLVASMDLDGKTVTSDALYKDSDGKTIVYPIGTYHIKEVSAPKYYQKIGTMRFIQNTTDKKDVTEGLTAVIRQDGNGQRPQIYDGDNLIDGKITAANLAVNVYDTIENGSISLVKLKDDGSKVPLAGVTFKLVGQEDGAEYTATTDANGKIAWDNLIPQHYNITEVKTVDGYNLLKDNIEVTLPIEMSLDEIMANGADINQAVYDNAAGKYCFYNLTFTVGDSTVLTMPFTGGNQNRLYVVLIIGIAGIAFGTYILIGRKKKHV